MMSGGSLWCTETWPGSNTTLKTWRRHRDSAREWRTSWYPNCSVTWDFIYDQPEGCFYGNSLCLHLNHQNKPKLNTLLYRWGTRQPLTPFIQKCTARRAGHSSSCPGLTTRRPKKTSAKLWRCNLMTVTSTTATPSSCIAWKRYDQSALRISPTWWLMKVTLCCLLSTNDHI